MYFIKTTPQGLFDISNFATLHEYVVNEVKTGYMGMEEVSLEESKKEFISQVKDVELMQLYPTYMVEEDCSSFRCFVTVNTAYSDKILFICNVRVYYPNNEDSELATVITAEQFLAEAEKI